MNQSLLNILKHESPAVFGRNRKCVRQACVTALKRTTKSHKYQSNAKQNCVRNEKLVEFKIYSLLKSINSKLV